MPLARSRKVFTPTSSVGEISIPSAQFLFTRPCTCSYVFTHCYPSPYCSNVNNGPRHQAETFTSVSSCQSWHDFVVAAVASSAAITHWEYFHWFVHTSHSHRQPQSYFARQEDCLALLHLDFYTRPMTSLIANCLIVHPTPNPFDLHSKPLFAKREVLR